MALATDWEVLSAYVLRILASRSNFGLRRLVVVVGPPYIVFGLGRKSLLVFSILMAGFCDCGIIRSICQPIPCWMMRVRPNVDPRRHFYISLGAQTADFSLCRARDFGFLQSASSLSSRSHRHNNSVR